MKMLKIEGGVAARHCRNLQKIQLLVLCVIMFMTRVPLGIKLRHRDGMTDHVIRGDEERVHYSV